MINPPTSFPCDPHKRYLFILSSRLGDSLVSLVLINNLVNNHYHIDVFGDFAFQLATFFPHLKIAPLNELSEEDIQSYDAVILQFPEPSYPHLEKIKPVLCVHDLKYFLEGLHMVEIQRAVCQRFFKIQSPNSQTGLILPNSIQSRKYKNRVIIHAFAMDPLREWPLEKYTALALQLNQQGFECHFIASPKERKRLSLVLEKKLSVPTFQSLYEVAGFIAESGYFIGNSSGIAHLSSCLGLPTLTLVARQGEYRLWRPYWTKGLVLAPPVWLLARGLKQRLWKYCLSVKKVNRRFTDLRNMLGE